MSWLSRLFDNPHRIRINPGSALNPSERELAVYIGLRVKLTYPFHNEAEIVKEVREKYHIDEETARWWLTHSISAMKEAGHFAETEPAEPPTPVPVERVVVGKCEQCGRDLRVKRTGVRPSMQLTCKCGHVNHIGPPRTEAADTVNAGDAQVTARVRRMSDNDMLPLLRDLCVAYVANDQRAIERLEPLATAIGEELNGRGGITEMRRVWERLGNIRGARTLDMHWNGIGDWRG